MADATSAGKQLYAQLAQLLAPADGVAGTGFVVILETAGKDVSAASTAAERDEMLADLVNTVPAAAGSFLDTGRSYDDVWDLVINSASPTGSIGDPGNATIAKLIADNQASFAMLARARNEEAAGIYHPVRPSPKDWQGEQGWSSVSFRVGVEPKPGPAVIPEETVRIPDWVVIPEEIPDLTWRTVEPDPDPPLQPDILETIRVLNAVREGVLEKPPRFGRVLDPEVLKVVESGSPELIHPVSPQLPEAGLLIDDEVGSVLDWETVWKASRAVEDAAVPTPATPAETGFQLSFEHRVVDLQRAWLRSELCHLKGWNVPAMDVGGLSNGMPKGNDGLMPVMTTRMLIVRNLVVRAHWTDADQAKAAAMKDGTISFGPFALTGDASFNGSEIRRPAAQVVAWLATVVPACPRT